MFSWPVTAETDPSAGYISIPTTTENFGKAMISKEANTRRS